MGVALWMWMWTACVRGTPPAPVSPPTPAPAEQALTEPDEGWYNGACYAALDGDVDRALALLARSIEVGEAPLQWMGEDPDLDPVRADPRYLPTRDAALEVWIDARSPTTGPGWMEVARAQHLRGDDVTEAVRAAESLGIRHAVFDPPLPAVTPSLAALSERRKAWTEARRGTVTVEIPAAFELANIILSQTTYGQTDNATDRSSAYSAEVDAWFAPHRDHPLIRELDALPVDMNVYYAFRNQSAAWVLEDGSLHPSDVYPVGSFGGGADPFAERVARIEDFVRDTDAQTFLDAHRPLYTARIEAYEEAVPIEAMWAWLEDHFPAEGDGRDALVVRSSLLIGGSHNASTLVVDGFSEGTMVTPLFVHGNRIEPAHLGPLARMVFTEIDHHYVNPVSARNREDVARAVADVDAFNSKADSWGYDSPSLTFNEYATWILFDVWWAEHCDAVACDTKTRQAGQEDTVRVMARRGFHRYADFRTALLPELAGRDDLEATWPDMLAWFASEGS